MSKKLNVDLPIQGALERKANNQATNDQLVVLSTRCTPKMQKELRIAALETDKSQQEIIAEAFELWKEKNGF